MNGEWLMLNCGLVDPRQVNGGGTGGTVDISAGRGFDDSSSRGLENKEGGWYSAENLQSRKFSAKLGGDRWS
jgi:hypothetical protein